MTGVIDCFDKLNTLTQCVLVGLISFCIYPFVSGTAWQSVQKELDRKPADETGRVVCKGPFCLRLPKFANVV